MIAVRSFILFAALLLAGGCATTPKERIPTYPLMDASQSLATMRQRNASVENVSGEGAVTMTDPKGGSVRFDAAFVFGPPDQARVRAYKFGQAVLDLTVKPDGLWLFLPREDGRADSIRAASRSTGAAIRQWLQLLAGEEQGASVQVDERQLVVTRQDGMTVRGEIDRHTLTARRYAMYDSAGVERFSLKLDRYRQLGDTVWPGRIEARSEAGTILIEMRDVELNAAPPAAFQPPRRAERLP